MEKRDVFKYLIIGLILAGLVGMLLVFQGGPTGFAIFGDDEEGEFDLGTYSNVEWNGSAVVLSSGQTSGTYTSQIFDAGNNATSSFSVDTSTSAPPNGSGGGGGGGDCSGVYVPTNKSNIGKLEVSQLGSIIVHEGDVKNISLSVKNIGLFFVNNCKLVANGDVESWIYSTQVEGIAPGENIDFIFNLNIPEEIEKGDYRGNLEISCDEASNIQEISVSVPSLNGIEINEIIQEDNVVKIKYNFDNSYIIGDTVSIEIWIEDSDGYEVGRIQDFFDANKQGLIERNVEIEFKGAGIYSVYFALSDDLESFVKESVILGKSETTGFAVLENVNSKKAIYAGFMIILALAIFFIWKRHGKNDKSSHVKHNWLLRKKKKH